MRNPIARTRTFGPGSLRTLAANVFVAAILFSGPLRAAPIVANAEGAGIAQGAAGPLARGQEIFIAGPSFEVDARGNVGATPGAPAIAGFPTAARDKATLANINQCREHGG